MAQIYDTPETQGKGQAQQVDTANMILLSIGGGQAIGRAQSMNATRSFGTQGVYE